MALATCLILRSHQVIAHVLMLVHCLLRSCNSCTQISFLVSSRVAAAVWKPLLVLCDVLVAVGRRRACSSCWCCIGRGSSAANSTRRCSSNFSNKWKHYSRKQHVKVKHQLNQRQGLAGPLFSEVGTLNQA